MPKKYYEIDPRLLGNGKWPYFRGRVVGATTHGITTCSITTLTIMVSAVYRHDDCLCSVSCWVSLCWVLWCCLLYRFSLCCDFSSFLQSKIFTFSFKKQITKLGQPVLATAIIEFCRISFILKFKWYKKAILQSGTKFVTGTKPKPCIGKVNNIWTKKLVR